MRRSLSVVACLLIAGCGASSGGEPGSRPEPASVVSGDSDGRTIHLKRDAGSLQGWIDAAPEEVWRRLPAVLAEIGLEPSAYSAHVPAERRIEVINHKTRRLAGQQLSRFLRCGYSMGTGSNQVYINLRVWLEPSRGGTNVNTRFDARVLSGGSSAAASNCGTIGTLEREIVERLQRRVLEGETAR